MVFSQSDTSLQIALLQNRFASRGKERRHEYLCFFLISELPILLRLSNDKKRC